MVVHRVCKGSRMEEEKTVFSFLFFCFLSSVWDWRYYDLMHWKLSILDISAPRPKGFARQYYASRNDIFWHKILPNTVRLEIQYIWQDIPKYIWVHFYGKSGKSKSRLGGSFRKGGWFICALTKGWQLHQNALYPLIHSPLCPHVPPLPPLCSDIWCNMPFPPLTRSHLTALFIIPNKNTFLSHLIQFHPPFPRAPFIISPPSARTFDGMSLLSNISIRKTRNATFVSKSSFPEGCLPSDVIT